MQMKQGGARVCPKCQKDSFISSDCKDDSVPMGGYRVQCVSCNWEGFSLQLSMKPGADVGPIPELAEAMRKQAQKSYKAK